MIEEPTFHHLNIPHQGTLAILQWQTRDVLLNARDVAEILDFDPPTAQPTLLTSRGHMVRRARTPVSDLLAFWNCDWPTGESVFCPRSRFVAVMTALRLEGKL